MKESVTAYSHWPNILVSLKSWASQRIRFDQVKWQYEHISTISIFPQSLISIMLFEGRNYAQTAAGHCHCELLNFLAWP